MINLMNRSFIILGISSAVALFCNCRVNRHAISRYEAIERKSTLWTFTNNVDSAFVISEKAWYQDSIGITQKCGIFTEGNDDVLSTKVVTVGYRFFDLRKKWAYEYLSFTDTAKIVRKYRYTDTTHMVGGWNFGNKKTIAATGFQVLPDTAIDGITFKRCSVQFNASGTPFEAMGLFRCDKKDSWFQLDTGISRRIGCPLVFFRMYPSTKPHSKFDQEIRFVSNQSEDSVIKVFAAWKKNERVYPVE
jgi:hypothetical protein